MEALDRLSWIGFDRDNGSICGVVSEPDTWA